MQKVNMDKSLMKYIINIKTKSTTLQMKDILVEI